MSLQQRKQLTNADRSYVWPERRPGRDWERAGRTPSATEREQKTNMLRDQHGVKWDSLPRTLRATNGREIRLKALLLVNLWVKIYHLILKIFKNVISGTNVNTMFSTVKRHVTEEDDYSGNACVLYSGRTRFESWPGQGLTWGLRGFSQSLYVNTGTVPQLSHGRILYNLFFTIIQSQNGM